METFCFNAFIAMCALFFCNNGSEVTKEKIDASVHSGQTISRQIVLLTIFKLKKNERQRIFNEKVGREHQSSKKGQWCQCKGVL